MYEMYEIIGNRASVRNSESEKIFVLGRKICTVNFGKLDLPKRRQRCRRSGQCARSTAALSRILELKSVSRT